ncbi:putative receptor [Klebsiella pneumoniae]|nr:putative receptor [Klebsiella pneumoniae]VAO05697.1 putative receptor [Klebsiella pneumoniae]
MAASPYPAYSSGSDCLQARQATAPPGDGIRHGAAFMPGGGYALPGLLVRLRLSVGPASNLDCAAGRWHQAQSCVYAGWRLRLTRPTRPAPTVCRPGKQRRRRAMASGTELRLCRVAATPYPAYSSGSDCLLARQATAPPGDGIRHGAAFMPGGGCALPGLLVRLRLSVGPASNGAARRWHQARSCFYAGWRLRLTRPTTPNHHWRWGC